MKTKFVKALLLNDVDPFESKGAASIALNLALRVFDDNEFVYVCTSKKANLPQTKHPFHLRYFKESIFDRLRDRARNRFPRLEGVLRILAVRRLWRIYRCIKEFSPEVIWVHQIGWRIPITSLLMFRALRIPVLFTIHDYTFLRFRKLYPQDFKDIPGNDGNIESQLIAFHRSLKPLNLKLNSKPNFWQKMTRFIISSSSNIVYLSDLQSAIYKSEGYPTGTIVNNTVRPCTCEFIGTKLSKWNNELHVLFAGRLIGKGLERLVDSFSSPYELHLHLAGGTELLDFAKASLPSNQFTFHGLLDEKELYELIHTVDVTAVASACFDVFPTITLESLAHGTPVISTPTTGNFHYILRVDERLALPMNGLISFAELREVIAQSSVMNNLDFIKGVVTEEESVDNYRALFTLASERPH
jgi:glycosyltransferase involved in cell wall biosynthesis